MVRASLVAQISLGFLILWCSQKVDGLPPGVKKHPDATEPVPDSDKDPDAPVSAQAAGGGDKAGDNAAKQDGNAASGDEAGGACGGRGEPEADAVNLLDSSWVQCGQERQRQHHIHNQTQQPNQEIQIVQGLTPEVNPHANSTLLVADAGQVSDASQEDQTGDVGTLGTPDDNTSEGTQSGGPCGGAHVEGVFPLDPPWPRHANAEAVQVQPPGPSLSPADSSQPVPGDAGQPNAGPLAAGGGGAEAGDDINPEGGAGTSPDGAWGGANTTSSALDAVQPLAENPERQSRREQWMREWADPSSDVSAESTLGIHVRDGAGLCAPPDTLDYGQNHSIHPQSHCDPWLNIHIRCGYDIQHPDLGDSEYVDLAWERSQRAAARRHRRGGQRPWNIQPEDDSTRTVDMQQARRPRRIMQGGVLLLVLLQVLVVMYMVLVFDTRLLHAQLNGHLQGDCRNAQHAVMDFRQLQVVVCLLVLAIWIIM